MIIAMQSYNGEYLKKMLDMAQDKKLDLDQSFAYRLVEAFYATSTPVPVSSNIRSVGLTETKGECQEEAKELGVQVPGAAPSLQPDETPPFDIEKARKDLKPAAWELLKVPVVKSLLYDINLLPEQITAGKHWFYMLSVLSHMDSALKRESGSGA